MAIKKGKILSGKEKKIKDKKLQAIRDSKIELNHKDCGEYVEVTIKLDRILEPAPRARVSGVYKKNDKGEKEMVGSRMYDPLSSYKDHIKKVFMNYFTQEDLGIELPFKGKVDVSLSITKVPPKSWSNKDKYYALMGELPFTVKPDVDNVEKTLFDCLNKILFKDDCQIISNSTEKIFYYQDSTTGIFRLYKPTKLPLRLDKKQTVHWKELEKKLVYREED